MSLLDLSFIFFMIAVLVKVFIDFNSYMDSTGSSFVDEIKDLLKGG